MSKIKAKYIHSLKRFNIVINSISYLLTEEDFLALLKECEEALEQKNG